MGYYFYSFVCPKRAFERAMNSPTIFRTLLWICYSIYFIGFLTLFPLDSRLELHQSLETMLVFDVPAGSKELKAVIEEGPFITRLLLPQDKKVFSLQ